MQFFKHMSSMRHDPKIRKLTRKFKAEGYAVYVWILEAIAEGISTDSPLPVLEEGSEDLSYDLGIPETRIEEIVNYCSDSGLLQIVSESSVVYCVKIYKFLNTSQTRSDSLRQMITAVSGAKVGEMGFDEIKIGIEKAILFKHKELPELKAPSQTVCDKYDRRDIEVDIEVDKEIEIEERENKTREFSLSPKKVYGIFKPEEKKPSKFKPFNPKESMSALIAKSIEFWNSHDSLPECAYNSINLPRSGEVAEKFQALGAEKVNGAIGMLGKYITKEPPQFQPRSFSNFVVDSVDSWLESCNPQKRYEPQVDISKIQDELEDATEIWKGMMESSGFTENDIAKAKAKVDEIEGRLQVVGE